MAKYFIEYKYERAKVRKEFDALPKGVYYAGGYQDPKDKGKAYLSRLTDDGTALVPLMVAKTGKQYKRTKK